MKNKLNNFYLLILISYLTLILGFLFNENITSGATDWPHVSKMITRFAENFQNYLPVYENRHSPLLYIILSGFKKAGLNFESIRFLYLHVNLITLFFMFKCIKIKYPNLKDFTILFLSISVILLSPNLRTASYWLLPYSLGFLFLVIFFYYSLKYLNLKSSDNNEIKYLLLSLFFLALSSYISPNFCLFIIYLFYIFLKKEDKKKNSFLIFFLISLILALPALYYTFIYNPFFIFNNTVANTVNETLRYNFSNKFVIISTIIFFHLFPFLIKININYLKSNYVTNYRYIILLLFIYFFTLFYFDFSPDYGGGGFFYKLSNILKNDYLFFIIYFISLIFIFLIINKNLNNFIFLIIFVLMNPQLSIYHRYYDPLIILSFLLFFDKGAFLKDMIDKKMIYIIFIYTLFFNILYILKNYI